ncbi:MAG: hypothetical protein OFPI_05100 [Osedax symbiont Rs2]|nr:MAG: hypothetical protein OFPI_05100 [Osedax symbiont Rs2]
MAFVRHWHYVMTIILFSCAAKIITALWRLILRFDDRVGLELLVWEQIRFLKCD